MTAAELEAAHSELRRLRRRHSTLLIGNRHDAVTADEEIEAIVKAVDSERLKRFNQEVEAKRLHV